MIPLPCGRRPKGRAQAGRSPWGRHNINYRREITDGRPSRGPWSGIPRPGRPGPGPLPPWRQGRPGKQASPIHSGRKRRDTAFGWNPQHHRVCLPGGTAAAPSGAGMPATAWGRRLSRPAPRGRLAPDAKNPPGGGFAPFGSRGGAWAPVAVSRRGPVRPLEGRLGPLPGLGLAGAPANGPWQLGPGRFGLRTRQFRGAKPAPRRDVGAKRLQRRPAPSKARPGRRLRERAWAPVKPGWPGRKGGVRLGIRPCPGARVPRGRRNPGPPFDARKKFSPLPGRPFDWRQGKKRPQGDSIREKE
jgi:hypothetical protein